MSEQGTELATFHPPRHPYHPAIQERFGIDKAGWKALTDAVFPSAKTAESIILALSYCKARNLDPFKRNVHIVGIWDNNRKEMVDTVWPGIGELRTTAFRTGAYAGRERTVFGPDVTTTWGSGQNAVEVTHPEWAQVTVYRLIAGQRVAFDGPPVYWLETFSDVKGGAPNSMWRKRPRGQLDKCAEAAALRAAFPEEIGDEMTEAEAGVVQAIPQYAEPAAPPPLEPGRHPLRLPQPATPTQTTPAEEVEIIEEHDDDEPDTAYAAVCEYVISEHPHTPDEFVSDAVTRWAKDANIKLDTATQLGIKHAMSAASKVNWAPLLNAAANGDDA